MYHVIKMVAVVAMISLVIVVAHPPVALQRLLTAGSLIVQQEWFGWRLGVGGKAWHRSFVSRFVDRLTTRLSEADAAKMHLKVDPSACASVVRIGHVGDGGWFVCEDMILQQKSKHGIQKSTILSGSHAGIATSPCVVYSIGIGSDTSFDNGIIKRYPHCQVFAFDPSLNRKTGDTFLGPNIHFFNIGLGATDVGILKDTSGKWTQRDDPNFPSWSKMRLRTIMKMLNHTYVDVLKIDIEGAEWRSMDPSWFKNPIIGQLLFEAHFGQKLVSRERDAFMIDMIGKVQTAGFKLFSRRANWRFSRPRDVYYTNSTTEQSIRTHACHELGLVASSNNGQHTFSFSN